MSRRISVWKGGEDITYLCLRSSRCNSDTTTAKAIMISAVAICAPVMMSVRSFMARMLLKDISNI